MASGKRSAGHPDRPELTPPGELPGQQAERDSGLSRVVWLLGAVVLLAVLVVFVLPGVVERVATRAPAPAETAVAPTPEPADAETSTDARAAAEQSLQAYLQLRARLDLERAGQWGEPEWSRSATLAVQGDRQFAQRRFPPAADAYARALGLLEQLADGREARYAAAMEEAGAALAGGDSETAIARYELALAIRPEDADATQGIARARVRPRLLEFMRRGDEAQAQGDLAAARDAYSAAVELDGEYPPAAAALERVSGRLDEHGYGDAMTRALAALDAGRLAEAERALKEAAGYRPEDVAVRDARRRLTAARQQSRLSALRRKAGERVRAEDWRGAVSVYRQALGVDPHAGFAGEGLAQALARVELHEEIDHYLDRPARLYSDEPLANAGQLLESAASAPADEPRLAAKLERLQRLVTDARTPLPVSLRSDGETEVVIYHVGRLGRFDVQSLQLRPGDYTVVGSRKGYRDVRKTLSVRPGAPGPVLDIRCEEPV